MKILSLTLIGVCLGLFMLSWPATKNQVHSIVLKQHEQANFLAVVVYDEIENAHYAVWSPPTQDRKGEWLFIMLPGTEFGITAYELDRNSGEFKPILRTQNKQGGPAQLTDK